MVLREIHNGQQQIFFLAIEPYGEKRLVLIPLTEGIGLVNPKHLAECRGVAVTKEKMRRVGPFTNQLCLVVRQTTSDTRIFETFAGSLCEDLWACTAVAVVPTLQKTMQKWQHFFSKATTSGLSPEERRGLYGELNVLRALLQGGCPATAVEGWQGPELKAVDFLFGPVGLEVKTTLSHQPLRVTIANEHQLSDQTAPILFLAVLPLRVTTHTGETLNELVGELRELLAEWPLSLASFKDLLLQAGYLDIHADLYQEERYFVLERRFYRVADGFPRLTASALPPGIVHVSYDLLLDGYDSYAMDEAAVITALRGHVNGA
jgi:hypothetical protein